MGGGGGGDPGAEARRQEAERQARIKAATEEIDRIFNNQVKKTATRYQFDPSRALIQSGNQDQMRAGFMIPVMSAMLGRNNNPQYIDESEYQAKLQQYNAALAKQQEMQRNNPSLAFVRFGMNTRGNSGLSAEEENILRTFNPAAFRAEQYEYWADGDPANSRDALYQQHRGAVYDINKMEVDRQATEAERSNRFGLARVGLLGGSADIDSNADLNRRTNEGLMRAGGVADQAAADLKVADERTRSNLISMAQSGIDTGSAASLALNGLKANADSVASQRAGASIGGLFNDLSQAYLMNQMSQGRAAGGVPGFSQWTGVSNPRTGDSGRVSR